MPFIYELIFIQIKLIFIRKILHEDSFCNRGERQLGNDVFALAFLLYDQVKWLAYENSRHFFLQSEVKPRNMENWGVSLALEGSSMSIQTRWDNVESISLWIIASYPHTRATTQRSFSVDNPTFSFGKYEVTPSATGICFLNLKEPKFRLFSLALQPYHSKSKQHQNNDDLKKIVDEVTAATKGFAQNARGFITDGDVALHESLKEGLINARGLSCFANFQRNCINKLNSFGIKQTKEQSFFIDGVFGKKEKGFWRPGARRTKSKTRLC